MDRIKKINTKTPLYISNGNILYLMVRDCRIEDNHALIVSQKLAIKNKQGLIIGLAILKTMSNRQYHFLLEGLKEIKNKATKLNISFFFIKDNENIYSKDWLKKMKIVQIVSDFSPLKELLTLKKKIPISCLDVDTHNIVPVWIASEKQEFAARTIRKKITRQLKRFAIEPEKIVLHPYTANHPVIVNDWNAYKSKNDSIPIEWCHGGTTNALKQLTYFLDHIKGYSENRNDPLQNAVSNLSPWLHFGFISSLRCYLEAEKLKKNTKSNSIKNDINSFIEEIVIRKELSDNYCYYNKNYDSLSGLPEWALKTLNEHKNDKRETIYSYKTLLNGQTNDKAWNMAQQQLIEKGKIHGYMRMYWAKKLIEWTKDYKTAYKYAIEMNDDFSIDGNDPNGYVGVLWCFGLHDRAWTERKIYGKIRYMSTIGSKLNKKL